MNRHPGHAGTAQLCHTQSACSSYRLSRNGRTLARRQFVGVYYEDEWGNPTCRGKTQIAAQETEHGLFGAMENLRLCVCKASVKDQKRRFFFGWRARQESNLYQELRKLSFYPLNYGRAELLLYLFLCTALKPGCPCCLAVRPIHAMPAIRRAGDRRATATFV